MIRIVAGKFCKLALLTLVLDLRLGILWTTFCAWIPTISSIHISINDTIRLIDPFGQERRLQYATHRHFPVFLAFLNEEYKDTPCSRYIAQGRYHLLDMKMEGLVPITMASWSDFVRPGSSIMLLIVVKKLVTLEGEVCLNCGKGLMWLGSSCRYTCPCGLVYFQSSDQHVRKPRDSDMSKRQFTIPTRRRRSIASTMETDAHLALVMNRQYGCRFGLLAIHHSGTFGKAVISTQARSEAVAKPYVPHTTELGVDEAISDGQNIAVFGRIMLESREDVKDMLSFNLIPYSGNVRIDSFIRVDLAVGSTPCLFAVPDSSGMHDVTELSIIKLKNTISLLADHQGSLWIQSEAPHLSVSVNRIPLRTNRSHLAPSIPRRLKDNDTIELRSENIIRQYVVSGSRFWTSSPRHRLDHKMPKCARCEARYTVLEERYPSRNCILHMQVFKFRYLWYESYANNM